MDPLLDFSGQTAIITGAASGFGRGLAVELAMRQCNLILSDIDTDGLQHTGEMLDKFDTKTAAISGDIADEQLAKALVDKAVSLTGRLDIAVNNAGIAHDPVAIHQITDDVLDKQLNVNLKGVMYGMKYQLQTMLGQGFGHILNVSSLAGLGGAPKGGAYVAAKHGVSGITRTAAVEYGRKNIRVNAICPFFSPTNILNIEGYRSPEAREQLATGSPMKRLGEPQEIINAMLLLLSPGNSYMNGQTIAIDGGVTAW